MTLRRRFLFFAAVAAAWTLMLLAMRASPTATPVRASGPAVRLGPATQYTPTGPDICLANCPQETP